MDIEVFEFPKDSLKSKLNLNMANSPQLKTKSLSLTARAFLLTAIRDCTN